MIKLKISALIEFREYCMNVWCCSQLGIILIPSHCKQISHYWISSKIDKRKQYESIWRIYLTQMTHISCKWVLCFAALVCGMWIHRENLKMCSLPNTACKTETISLHNALNGEPNHLNTF